MARMVCSIRNQFLLGASSGCAMNVKPEDVLISIVDDDHLVGETVGALVESLGHKAAIFNSAEHFLQSEVMKKTSCLITDLQMPGLNGLELQKELQSRGYRTPVIVVSGHCEEEARARALCAGAIGFLRKPLDTDLLIEYVKTAIKLRAS
jgi:FixJ family two-component response regulator